jgi:hypothetical protein
MGNPSFEEKRDRLKALYHSLLAENGLADVDLPEHRAAENFNAMYDAGWFQPATRQVAWERFDRTRKSSPIGYARIVDMLSKDVEAALIARGAPLANPVYAGPWPIGYTNACAMRVDGGALVLVSAGMISLIYQVGKQFVYSFDWMKADDSTLTDQFKWKHYGWTMEKTVDVLVDVFASYFRNGDPSTAQRPGVPELGGRAATLGKIVHFAEHFLVAHEYSHIALEHTGPLGTV